MSGCKWCSTDRESVSGRCTATLDDGKGSCDFLTLSASSCPSNPGPDRQVDEAPLPVDVIGGAVGGGLAALLLIALVVCLVLRARRNNNSKPSNAAANSTGGPEMATARESNSGHYGDIRLTNIYSAAGLSAGGSVASTGASGSSGDAHYSPMDMK